MSHTHKEMKQEFENDYKVEPQNISDFEKEMTATYGDSIQQMNKIYKSKRIITPSKYTKNIHGVQCDVYDVIMAWNVTNPALQHLIKKALQAGDRGHKSLITDLQDIIDSAIRAKELQQ